MASMEAMEFDNRKSLQIRTGIILTILIIVAVVLRFVARYIRKLEFKADDWFALASLVSSISTLSGLLR